MASDTRLETFTQAELQAITEAAAFFERPGMFAKSLNWVGLPIEYAQRKLPKKARQVITRVSKAAIERALTLSINTVPIDSEIKSFSDATLVSKRSGSMHTGAATVVGGIGGFFGLVALPLELPIATLVMLRSIVDIAQNYGNDLSAIETRLECMYVFSLGNRSSNSDVMESAYYTSRVVFGDLLKSASAYIAATSAAEILAAIENRSAPILVRLIADIAAQFEIRVTRKFLLQAAPVAGAVGGAGINLLFAHYFQNCARHHFAIKNIEKTRGFELTRMVFEEARQKFRGGNR